MKKNATVRNPAMDIIRCFALLGVISIHFFLHTGYYELILTGKRVYLFTLLRCASMICVPLFIMLSGYLLKNKKPQPSYYTKLGKTVSIYILASLCCYIYAHYLAADAAGTGSLGELLRGILSFQAAPYAWYIQMYLGLFLLIPYLNLIYQGLPDEKSRRQLVLTMIILTALPGVINVFRYNDGWQFTGNSFIINQIFPNWWQFLYPLTYYFLGSYLRDHPLKLKRSVNALLLLAVVVVNGSINFWICYEDYYLQASWQAWESLPNLIQSVLIFNLLAQGNYSKAGPRTCAVLARLSDWCLGGYLVSWIFDSVFYRILNDIQPETVQKLLWYPVIVPVVYLCSLALSGGINLVYSLLAKLPRKLFPQKNTVK